MGGRWKPTTEIRNAAELAVTPDHDQYDQYGEDDDDGDHGDEVDIGDWGSMGEFGFGMSYLVFGYLEFGIWDTKYSVTFTHCKLNEVDIGDVEALRWEEVAEAEQEEGDVGQQPAQDHQFGRFLGIQNCDSQIE